MLEIFRFLNARTGKVVILMEMAIVFVMAYSLWYKVFLPSAYFVGSILLGILFATSMLRRGRRRYLIFQMLLLFLLLRNVYYLATQYSSIPFGDPYWDYGVIATFLEADSVFVIPAETSPATYLTWYSGWPLLHVLVSILSRISSIDPFYITLIFPSIFSTLSFIFVYLLVEKIRCALNLNDMVTFFALLIYATMPEALYWPMRLTHQNMGMLFLTIIFYLMCKTISQRNRVNSILIIVFSMSLVLTHHLTSFITMFYLFLFSTFVFVGTFLSTKTKIDAKLLWSKSVISFWNITAILFALIFLWWNNFGTVIWPKAGGLIRRFIELITGIREIEQYMRVAYYPNALTPIWASPILILRDIILYIPAIFGFLYILKRKTETPQKVFVVYSSIVFGFLFIVNFMITRFEPVRYIVLSLPFISICSAIFYNKLLNKQKYALRMLAAIIIVIMISSSFVGLWAHTYVPLHLYDPSIKPVDVGEHSINYFRLKGFFNEYVSYENFDNILADDIFPLYVILSPAEYGRIQRANIKNLADGSMLVELRKLNLYTYYYHKSPQIKPWEAEFTKLELEYHLETKFNIVYADGDFRIWSAWRTFPII